MPTLSLFYRKNTCRNFHPIPWIQRAVCSEQLAQPCALLSALCKSTRENDRNIAGANGCCIAGWEVMLPLRNVELECYSTKTNILRER